MSFFDRFMYPFGFFFPFSLFVIQLLVLLAFMCIFQTIVNNDIDDVAAITRKGFNILLVINTMLD